MHPTISNHFKKMEMRCDIKIYTDLKQMNYQILAEVV